MNDEKPYEGQQFGEYQSLSLLGSGGFGRVYLGQHIRDRRKVAIKVLQAQQEQPYDLKAFINEARTIRLTHPNIIRLLDFGIEAGNTPYIVMEYAPYGTLRHRHPRGTRVPLSAIDEYVSAISAALYYAHEHYLVHRDVKPENMLIGPQQQIWLSDFGIAALAQNSNSLASKGMQGTLPYMAPEQIQGKPRPASDQYALGVVVYEWLSGQRPFTGTFAEILTQHLSAPPPPLRTLVPALSEEVEQVVFIALEKDLAKRFATIQAFAQALHLALTPTKKLFLTSPLSIHPPQVSHHAEKTMLSPADTSPLPPAIQQTALSPHISSRLPSARHTSPQKSRRAILVSMTAILTVTGFSALALASQLFSANGNTNTPRRGTNSSARSTPSPTSMPLSQSTLVYTYHGHSAYVYTLQWSVNDTRLLSSSDDATVQLWDATTGGHSYIYHGHTARVNEAVWSPDNLWIASAASDNQVRIWNAQNGVLHYTYTKHSSAVFAVAWSHDGTRIASGEALGVVHVWSIADGQLLYTYTGHKGVIDKVAWSHDSTRIVSGSRDGTAQVWNAADGGNRFIYSGHRDTVYRVSWSPDGTRIASASDDQTAQIWEAANGKNAVVCRGHTNSVMDLAWSPYGERIVTASKDHTVCVWSSDSGKRLYTYNGHVGQVLSVAWSHDGSHIASGGDDVDPSVYIWDAK